MNKNRLVRKLIVRHLHREFKRDCKVIEYGGARAYVFPTYDVTIYDYTGQLGNKAVLDIAIDSSKGYYLNGGILPFKDIFGDCKFYDIKSMYVKADNMLEVRVVEHKFESAKGEEL